MDLTVLIVTNTKKVMVSPESLEFPRIKSETVIVTSVDKKEFDRDFSALRNYAISKAKGDWILFLDADENLSPELIEAIPELIKNSEVEGYWFRRKTFISPTRYLKHGLLYPDWQLRLFRNKGYNYHGAVHEQLDIPFDKTEQVPVDIRHFPTHPKYTRFADFRNLMPYIQIRTKELSGLNKSYLWYWWQGMGKFCSLFFGGFIRGKGFLDGWAGLRAHLMFAYSIALGYFKAARYEK